LAIETQNLPVNFKRKEKQRLKSGKAVKRVRGQKSFIALMLATF